MIGWGPYRRPIRGHGLPSLRSSLPRPPSPRDTYSIRYIYICIFISISSAGILYSALLPRVYETQLSSARSTTHQLPARAVSIHLPLIAQRQPQIPSAVLPLYPRYLPHATAYPALGASPALHGHRKGQNLLRPPLPCSWSRRMRSQLLSLRRWCWVGAHWQAVGWAGCA